MQRTVLSFFFVTLTALCAVASADATAEPMFLVPGGTLSTPTLDNWRGLLRREIGRMLERREPVEEENGRVVLVGGENVLHKRQAAGARNEDQIKNLDLEAWARNTTQKCVENLANVTKASNPSGIAVCYNLPFLSTESGVFAADLRLYQVSPPEGEWASIGGNIDVSLVYDGAAVQLRNETADEARASNEASASSQLQKVQEFHFIGQIDKQLLADKMSDLQLQAMLKPKVDLVSETRTGTKLNITLSGEEATFVNGVFANIASSQEKALASASAVAVPFKLPGTRIEIVPIGLYFFGAYMALACAIFGWGTFERQKYRYQYRKRIATQGKGSSRAI